MSYDPADCAPLSLTRRIADFPIGNVPLSEHQRQWIGKSKVKLLPEAWLDQTELRDFLTEDVSTLVDASGNPIAWKGEQPDLGNSIVAKLSFIVRFPWQFLTANEIHVGEISKDQIKGQVHPSAVIEGRIHLGTGTRILPGVFIEGNVIIGENCKIGPNCYIRGNTSIGDKCHIGQSVEIKNCVILSNTNVGHLSYIGDSVLGEKVNLGAGTTTSNLRHDGKNHRSMVHGQLLDTGRRKFGAIIGDGVHTGINTSIYPGRKFWPNTSTRPAEIVQHDLLA